VASSFGNAFFKDGSATDDLVESSSGDAIFEDRLSRMIQWGLCWVTHFFEEGTASLDFLASIVSVIVAIVFAVLCTFDDNTIMGLRW
jgi:hypothetical protein